MNLLCIVEAWLSKTNQCIGLNKSVLELKRLEFIQTSNFIVFPTPFVDFKILFASIIYNKKVNVFFVMNIKPRLNLISSCSSIVSWIIWGLSKNFNSLSKSAIDETFLVIVFPSPRRWNYNMIIILLTKLRNPLNTLEIIYLVITGEVISAKV